MSEKTQGENLNITKPVHNGNSLEADENWEIAATNFAKMLALSLKSQSPVEKISAELDLISLRTAWGESDGGAGMVLTKLQAIGAIDSLVS